MIVFENNPHDREVILQMQKEIIEEFIDSLQQVQKIEVEIGCPADAMEKEIMDLGTYHSKMGLVPVSITCVQPESFYETTPIMDLHRRISNYLSYIHNQMMASIPNEWRENWNAVKHCKEECVKTIEVMNEQLDQINYDLTERQKSKDYEEKIEWVYEDNAEQIAEVILKINENEEKEEEAKGSKFSGIKLLREFNFEENNGED